ncbi:MAG: DnaA regulatory inactivator Hda [Steroidobacteraceae bacterium]
MTSRRDVSQQIPLPIQLRASSVFTSYCMGANHEALSALQNLRSTGPSPVVFLYGVSGTGKTHLLQAACVRASETQQQASYLPLRELHQYGPELLQGAEHTHLVCLDDVSEVLYQPDWSRALFNLHRDLEEQGGKLLLADAQAPAALTIALPDLASRIMAGTILRLQPLDDTAQIEALQLHANQRGLILPSDVVSYLLRRLPRDMHSLCGFLDELDLASLTAQRKLTVPFVKEVLAR